MGVRATCPAGRSRRAAWAVLVVGALLAPAVATPVRAEPANEALRQRIEGYVRERLLDPEARVTVPPLGDFEIRGAAPETLRVALSMRSADRLSGTVPVSVTISDGRTVRKRGVVTVRVRSERRVVVAARHIPRGAPIGPDDLTVERRDAKRLHATTTDEPGALLGRVASRTIRAGTPVRADWTERPTAVERGQRVRIVLENAGLRIEATGEARSDGAVGDVIRVVNSDSSREVMGRIGPDGAVHVVF